LRAAQGDALSTLVLLSDEARDPPRVSSEYFREGSAYPPPPTPRRRLIAVVTRLSYRWLLRPRIPGALRGQRRARHLLRSWRAYLLAPPAARLSRFSAASMRARLVDLVGIPVRNRRTVRSSQIAATATRRRLCASSLIPCFKKSSSAHGQDADILP